MFIFSTGGLGQGLSFDAANVRGVALLYFHDQGGSGQIVEFRYYGKGKFGFYAEVPRFTLKLPGVLSLDSVRALHFAACRSSNQYELPQNSNLTALYFPESRLREHTFASRDGSSMLVSALCLDGERQTGLQTLGFWYEPLSESLGQDALLLGKCSDAAFCTVNNSKKCYGPKFDCGVGDGDCMANSIDAFARSESSEYFGIDLATLWDFRDGYLSSSERGQMYISFYYLWSQYSTKSQARLLDFLSLMPSIYEAVSIVEGGADSDVVIDSSFSQAILALIDAEYAAIPNSQVRRALTIARHDVEQCTGLPRHLFLAYVQGD